MKKGAVIAAVLSVGIAALLIYLHAEKASQASSVEAAPVEVAVQTVTHESVDVTLDLPGRTQAYPLQHPAKARRHVATALRRGTSGAMGGAGKE